MRMIRPPTVTVRGVAVAPVVVLPSGSEERTFRKLGARERFVRDEVHRPEDGTTVALFWTSGGDVHGVFAAEPTSPAHEWDYARRQAAIAEVVLLLLLVTDEDVDAGARRADLPEPPSG